MSYLALFVLYLKRYTPSWREVQEKKTREDPTCVNNISPMQQHFLWKMTTTKTKPTMKSDENKCASNYSIITNNMWNVNTHNNMQLTKHDTNDDVDFDNCVVHTVRWCVHIERTDPHCDDTAHLIWLKFWAVTLSSPCHPWRVLFDSISPFFFYFSFLSFSVYFLHNELFLELDNPIVMANLRYSAAEKSEGTVNASHSFTTWNLLNVEQAFSFDSDVSTVPVNPQLDSKKMWGSTMETCGTWEPSNVFSREEGKLASRMKEGSLPKQQRNNAGEQQEGIKSQRKRTRVDSHNMQISDYRYLEKVLREFARAIAALYLLLVAKANLDTVSTTISRVPKPREFGCMQEHQLRGAEVRHPIIPFGSLVEYHPITAKDQSRIHQFRKKILPGLFLGYALYAWWHMEGWRTDRRPWGVGNDGRIGNLLKKTQWRKKVIFPKEKRRIYFSNRRWTNQNPRRRSGTENIHLDTPRPNRGEGNIDFLGESEGSLPQSQGHFRMPVKR